MKHKLTFLLTLLLVAGVLSITGQAQDPNNPDTLELVLVTGPDANAGQMNVQIDIYVYSDETIVAASSGYTWDNPNLQMDSAFVSPLVESGFDLVWGVYEDNDIATTNANRHFQLGGASLFSNIPPDASGRRLWASYYFTLSDWTVYDSIVIDTLAYSDGTTYLFVADGQETFEPVFTGKLVIYDPNRPQEVNLIVDPDSLYFHGIEGGSSPAAQSFVISSDGDPLNFNIVENIGWAVPSPIQGTTVQTINVLINTIGLTAGTYIDSLRIDAAGAANSPQYVKLVLQLDPPPPVINTEPDEFYFNAIAGGSNPPSKTMTITNTGGGTLNWTLSHSQSWLALSPMSGTDSGDVTVSVDITGLPFGDYFDTILISDPNATNNPDTAYVYLTVASDLPVINVDSAFNYIIVPSGVSSVPPRHILVKNDGGGTMNFWLEETSTRILSTTPSSGTAPQDVEVEFKVIGGQAGNDYYDTLWVYSNEAINSPFPVVFLFHYVDDAAELYLTRDTIQLNVFECDMGAGVGMPSETFFINNIGGDDPLEFYLIYETDYFTVSQDSGVAPFGITVTAQDLQLPLGAYYDTILVAAQKAINSPETLIVQFNMIAGLNQPEIYLPKNSYTIPSQENSGPAPPNAFEILNKYGGCMPWMIEEDVPWMFPNPDSGDVHGVIDLYVDAAGYLFGEYTDSFFVVAPSATNTPQKVDLLLRVWRFHGDWDYNGEINVADLTQMVDWLFDYGHPPEPELIVGDLNCSLSVDVADLTYFVNYLFKFGPIPCGNPY